MPSGCRPPEKRLTLLQDNLVYYQNQPIAIVGSRDARGRRTTQPHWCSRNMTPLRRSWISGADFRSLTPAAHNNEPGDQSWGDVEGGLQSAAVRVDGTYTTPIHHHNPMEPHATIAQWQGDRLTFHDATQHITGVQEEAASSSRFPRKMSTSPACS